MTPRTNTLLKVFLGDTNEHLAQGVFGGYDVVF